MYSISNIDQVAVAQEFHISVTPLGEDEYLVRIEEVAPGVPLAEEQVRWPVEDWLAQARQLMNDPLLGVLQGNPAFMEDIFFSPEWEEPVSQSSLNLVALGQQFYNALFQGSLRDSWIMAQAIAHNQGKVLRLRLGLKGTRLPRLPWEVLHEVDRPLATGIDVAFSRYQLGTERKRLVDNSLTGSNQSLRILMVIASPSDQEALELEQEANHLKAELSRRSSNSSPIIELDILKQPGRERLAQELEQGQYQVFHYAGHSNLGESGGDLYLVSNKTGLTETLTGDDLAGLLVNNEVQLAVFNSCRGAYTATSNALDNGKDGNLAEALVKRGIPAVLAMAERIPDEVALTLTRLFYRNLNQGYPIDFSLCRARQGLIAAYGSNQLYWALPVLYLHRKFDGYLTRNRKEPDIKDEDKDEDDPLPPFHNAPDSDTDDPSAFIRDLLDQLHAEPANGELGGLGSEVENRSRATSDESALPANIPSSQPSLSKNSAANNLPVGATQASIPLSENLIHSPEPGKPWNQTGLRLWLQKIQRFPRLWMVLGATGVLAIALLGFWFFQNRASSPDSSIPGVSQTSSSQNVNLKTAKTAIVTNLAIEKFNQGNIAAGQKAVEELLNRETLAQAKAALDAVPRAQLDDPAISFLRGRLAWQSVKSGSKDYDWSDARRYWNKAHDKQPKSFVYLNALGFAYYAEGNYERANQAWWDALTLIEPGKGTANVAGGTTQKEALNAYAGLALGMRKYAQKQPADKKASLLNKSLKLRQKVMNDDPVNFQPNALSKNWLWSQQAIQDWRSLLAAKN